MVMERLGDHGHHGAIDRAEGAVWRCERLGKVDFLGKFVRPEKVDGTYLPEISGKDAIWNWQPKNEATIKHGEPQRLNQGTGRMP